MSKKDPVTTVRLDRRTKLAITAATIIASFDRPLSQDVKEAVDGAFLIEAEIEEKISKGR